MHLYEYKVTNKHLIERVLKIKCIKSVSSPEMLALVKASANVLTFHFDMSINKRSSVTIQAMNGFSVPFLSFLFSIYF